MVDLSKFTFNRKILSKIVILNYNRFCSYILSLIFLEIWRAWPKTPTSEKTCQELPPPSKDRKEKESLDFLDSNIHKAEIFKKAIIINI